VLPAERRTSHAYVVTVVVSGCYQLWRLTSIYLEGCWKLSIGTFLYGLGRFVFLKRCRIDLVLLMGFFMFGSNRDMYIRHRAGPYSRGECIYTCVLAHLEV
jgi:hypothetical protein